MFPVDASYQFCCLLSHGSTCLWEYLRIVLRLAVPLRRIDASFLLSSLFSFFLDAPLVRSYELLG